MQRCIALVLMVLCSMALSQSRPTDRETGQEKSSWPVPMPDVDAEVRKMLWTIVNAPDNVRRPPKEGRNPEVEPRRQENANGVRFSPEGVIKRIQEDQKLADKVIPWLLKMSVGGLQARMSEAIRDTSAFRALGVLSGLGKTVHPYCREALLEPSPLRGIEAECVSLLGTRPDILTEVLAKGPVEAKIAAAGQLGRFSPEKLEGLETAQVAVEALDIENVRLQHYLCYLLARIGSAPAGASEKFEKLIWSSNAMLAASSMEAFAAIGGARATLPLLRRFTEAKNHNPLRQAVLVALGRGSDPMAVGFLVARLSESDDTLRAFAARSLGDIGSSSAVPALIAVAREDGQEWVRTAALEALGRIRDPRALDLLVEALDSQSDRIRLVAIEAMGELGRREGIAPLEKILNADNPGANFRSHAVRALGKVHDAQAAWTLIDFLQEQGRFIPAFQSLQQITGQDFGTDIDAWVQYRRDFQAALQESGESETGG